MTKYRSIKSRIKEIRQDVKDVKKWNGEGYSDGFVSGYKKAYEQIDHIINTNRL